MTVSLFDLICTAFASGGIGFALGARMPASERKAFADMGAALDRIERRTDPLRQAELARERHSL